MSLAHARDPDGRPVDLPGRPPYAASALEPLRGVPFSLPADDPWVLASGDAAHTYVDAAQEAWDDYPDWMDFLDLASPANAVKRASRDLYLHPWRRWLDGSERVLDVGCGIGRFVQPLLDEGRTVVGVDPDLQSLQRCAWYAAGRKGRLDLHWSTAHRLPDGDLFDAVIACEVLCYVPDVTRALQAIVTRLKPGGALLIGMEARWGWALAPDASPVSPEALLGETAIVDVPGDRWVRTVERDELAALLQDAGLRVEGLQATHYVPEGPLERAAPEAMFLEEMLDLEDRCRAHPVWGPLNRIWTGVAVKPG